MKVENEVAIAKTILETKEKLPVLIPTGNGILTETLFFSDEAKEAPEQAAHTEVNEAELQMTKTLINARGLEFRTGAIQRRIQGKAMANHLVQK